MSANTNSARWVAPVSGDAHVRFALVRHEERLFSYTELLAHTPRRQAFLALQSGATSPQEWWDLLLARWPAVALLAVGRCQPRDGEILDLFVVRHEGSA